METTSAEVTNDVSDIRRAARSQKEAGIFFLVGAGAGGQWGTKIDVPTQKTNMASRKIHYLKMYFQLRSHLHLKVCTSPRGTCRWARSQSDMPALNMGMSIAIFFRVYNPYLGGLEPSLFHGFWGLKALTFKNEVITCFVVWNSTMGSHHFAPPFGEYVVFFLTTKQANLRV